jgi:F-type H+-transporting ATPase subunit epsilon
MKSVSLVIATPDALVVEAEVQEVVAPGSDGYFGVLPGHCLFISTLQAGTVRYKQGEETHALEIQGGFADVKQYSVTILAQGLIPPEIVVGAGQATETDRVQAITSRKH